MSTVRPIGALCAFVLAGCAELPAPSLDEVEPSQGHPLQATPVTIVGHDLYLGVDDRFDTSDATLHATFVADLDGAPLEAVTWIDFEHLSAVVPAGLPLGTRTLTVLSPSGRRAKLRHAFEVTSDDDGLAEVADLPGLAPSTRSVTAGAGQQR